MRKIYVSNNRSQQTRGFVMMEGDAEKYEIDFRAWEDDNETVTSVTVTVEAGQAAISSESFASGVKTMTVTTSNSGKALIKLVATGGSYSNTIFIRLLVKDPEIAYTEDYGLTTA